MVLTFAGTYVMQLMVGHVNVRWYLGHAVDAMLGMGVGLGGAC